MKLFRYNDPMMNKELLKQVIFEQNKRSLPDSFIDRAVFEHVQALQDNREIIIISGIRRCGKSTLLQKIRHEQTQRDYYLNFEDDRLIKFTIEDFQTLLETFYELFGQQRIFYFDEIQNIFGWERFVRRLYEDGNKIFITGSNATMLSKELGTKLTGRYIAVTLYPYSFQEYCNHFAAQLITKKVYTTSDKGKIKKLFSDYCRVGGIPEFVNFECIEYFHDVYDSIVYRDIITRYKLTHEKPIKELAFYLASNIAKEISFNALRKIIDVSGASTVADYCHYLENSFLCFLINRYSHSLKKQIYYAKKNYFIDHAFAKAIGFRISEDKGRLLENIVFLELKRRNHDIFFHKDKKECDFVIRHGTHIETALQVCTALDTQETKEREYAGLIEALQAYQLKQGFILTEDTEMQEQVSIDQQLFTIECIPVWKWLIQNKL
jgi:uncharacterized protein